MNSGTNISMERMEQLMHEHVEVLPFDPEWPRRYQQAEALLQRSLPAELVARIAHIGSTAVPGLSAKPIIDIQVEVGSLERVRQEVVPIMEELGYEFIWRPTMGEKAPFYAWFIKRDKQGQRTEHVHMVEPDAASEDRILFRDHLRAHPEAVQHYEELKRRLAERFPNDRAAYTQGKSDFVTGIVAKVRAGKA
ncbi:MAG: GrpB family protein [Flavobacteriales bacterium]